MELGSLRQGWNELGVVGTIYEEEEDDEFDSLSSPLSSESNHSPLLSAVDPRSVSKRHDPDVVIHVQDSSFRLHKEALMARSTYLKSHLTDQFSEITLSPPLNITAETFSLIADFCYGDHVPISPFNVAALRTAAGLLEMTGGGRADDNLQQMTEAYFRRAVAVDKDCASIVLRSCLRLLPDAETTACLVSRCIEALRDAGGKCLEDVFKGVGAEDLQVVLASMTQRLTDDSHDLLYTVIDIYLKENNGKLSEDQKIRMCNHIDCNMLSPRLLMHAVQNPTMPLRFVVQAMFVEQLNTRHSIISAADHRVTATQNKHGPKDVSTLGAILQRDAALRQVSHLKAAMSTTNSRIQALEKELSGMKKVLAESETSVRWKIDTGRSASFRLSSEDNKIERGQIGSVSSLGLRHAARIETSSSSEESSNGVPSVEKSFGQRLMRGLRSAFRLQKKKPEGEGPIKMERNSERVNEEDGNNNEDDIVVIKKDRSFHRRSSSQS